ncbi:3-oxoacyl-ACP synthase III family protein [Chryseobacterium jejuense]|uniref:3-oxoacyl-[acyl-carrier-protein] synthase 3 n=1 Tax=Chryseobacterium jejuense TaxID=445960 RepID=A0A2X2Z7S6_CHRJE|nr:ketoacyl-ACP synthase III [Chryseobacterium jejuense]SDJ34895.1 3-oxoacyl-[acyl-carrier-protein] synthase-3 [Chryseobacterium jejuense]SQB45769.1 3-oxoacyl-[acyl-carrier-protein] synthase 3 [Chryseobacterium jejuense]
MAFIQIPNVLIKGISACVPKNIVKNESLGDLFPEDELKKTIESVGIVERRIVDTDTCASDLCFNAAEQLLNEMDIDRSSIDVLIFMSQTSDFRIPATAPILQHRLGLSKDTLCFDVSLACSGYVYALTTALSYLNLPNVNRVLLLDGETFSKIVNPKDKTNALLYGDAGTATLLEKGNSDFNAVLHTDGEGWSAVCVPGGGSRKPFSEESLLEKEREDGSIGNDLEVYMNGIDVFNFTLRVVPKSIKELLEKTGTNIADYGSIVFHQANKFMIEFFAKKLKYDMENVPISLDKFGNTSSATIPLTIVSELRNWEAENKKIVISGFGAGLSWAAASIDLSNTHICELTEY